MERGFRYQSSTIYEWRQYNVFRQLIQVLQDEGETAYECHGNGTHIVGEQRTEKLVQFYLRGHNLIASYRYDAFGQEKELWEEEEENPFLS